MSLLSSIGAGIKNAAGAVGNTVSNLAKQTSALLNSSKQPAAASMAFNATSPSALAAIQNAGYQPVANSSGNPITAYKAGSSLPAASPTSYAASGGSSPAPADPFAGGAPRSIIGPQGPGAYTPSSSSGGSYAPYSSAAPTSIPSTSIGNAYQALQRSSASPTYSSSGSGGLNSFVNGSSTASPDLGMQTSTPKFSSYGGAKGTDTTSYYAGTPLSLEAQANGANNATTDPKVASQRANNQAIIAQENADAPRKKAEADAAAADAARIKEAADAASAAALKAQNEKDPNQDPQLADAQQADLDKQAKDLQSQYDALQSKVDELSKPSPEYLAALEEEKQLNEQENTVKTGLSSALNEVNNQPVAQGFLTGQGARLQNLANTELGRIAGQKVTLTQRLATEAQRRQAAMDVAKIGLTRAGSRADTASNRAYEYGQSQQTRKQNKADKTYSVSAGETVYDAKGNVIARGPYKPTVVTPTEKANNDVNNAIGQFKQIMATKGWRGVSPDDYKTMADHLQKTYGYKAVADLKDAMKANGMQIDDANFDGGGA